MKFYRLWSVLIIVLLSFTSVLVFAQDATQEPAATLPSVNMENALVPCGDSVTGPCDMIATKPEDIAGVWKQYLEGPFFNAPGEVAYIRFNSDGSYTMADSVENTTQPFQNYPTGTFTFDGQNFSTPVVLTDGIQAPCLLDTDAYQARVLKFGDQPVAMQFVFISDGCAGRILDWSQPLVWVAPSE